MRKAQILIFHVVLLEQKPLHKCIKRRLNDELLVNNCTLEVLLGPSKGPIRTTNFAGLDKGTDLALGGG
jgi:hypothetical protein